METKLIFVLMGDDRIKGFGKSPENTFQQACISQEIGCDYRMQTCSQVEPFILRDVALPVELRT